MRIKFTALVAAAVLLANFAAFAKTDDHKKPVKKAVVKRQVSRLTTMLPASDAVALFDAKKFFSDALPRLFASNQPVLNEITTKLAEMQAKTGVDLTKFQQAAVGVAFKQQADGKMDYQPIVLAGGTTALGAMADIARLAKAGSYREENIGGHTVYIFSGKAAVPPAATTNSNAVAGWVNDAIDSITKDIAVTELDSNTLALGTLDRVREVIDGKTHVGADLTALISQRDATVASFAMKPYGGMAKLIPLDDDDLGKNLDGIRYLSGAVDFSVVGGTLSINAKTEKAEQAADLKSTLDGLRILGKAVFGNSKRADQQMYGRLIDNAKVTQRLNSITLQLDVPQADLDKLVGLIK